MSVQATGILASRAHAREGVYKYNRVRSLFTKKGKQFHFRDNVLGKKSGFLPDEVDGKPMYPDADAGSWLSGLVGGTEIVTSGGSAEENQIPGVWKVSYRIYVSIRRPSRSHGILAPRAHACAREGVYK